jgi:predicted TIM-barrel fold metal-dependent hydrolase
VPSRKLDFPVFDVDNHFYETKDSLTKYLPREYRKAIQYVEVGGRTKIAILGKISDYIPNPTFDVVAAPGAQEQYFRHGNPEGKSYRELMGDPIRAIPAYREPGPRLELMDELGIDRALIFPTLASLLEERMAGEPEVTHAAIHALNEWMYEVWSFNYKDRIFPVPVITLPIVDKAIAELEWVLERGARTILVRPAPVPGYRGSRSFGLPEFDPFWKRVVEANIPVSMHASDSGYEKFATDWEGGQEFLPFKPTPFRMIIQGKRPIQDAMTALVCHGALSRFPELRIITVENGAGWVRPLLKEFGETYAKMPRQFDEDPVEVFKRNIYVNPFWEDNLQGLIDVVGEDHVLFGSDYPHPEGMRDPISYVDDLAGLPSETVAKIIGGNLAKVMNMPAAA